MAKNHSQTEQIVGIVCMVPHLAVFI